MVRATGDRGFNHSRCTVECDLGQVVHTHCPAPLKLRTYGQFKALVAFLKCRVEKTSVANGLSSTFMDVMLIELRMYRLSS